MNFHPNVCVGEGINAHIDDPSPADAASDDGDASSYMTALSTLLPNMAGPNFSGRLLCMPIALTYLIITDISII